MTSFKKKNNINACQKKEDDVCADPYSPLMEILLIYQ